jgi:hypothetical protein
MGIELAAFCFREYVFLDEQLNKPCPPPSSHSSPIFVI